MSSIIKSQKSPPPQSTNNIMLSAPPTPGRLHRVQTELIPKFFPKSKSILGSYLELDAQAELNDKKQISILLNGNSIPRIKLGQKKYEYTKQQTRHLPTSLPCWKQSVKLSLNDAPTLPFLQPSRAIGNESKEHVALRNGEGMANVIDDSDCSSRFAKSA